MKARGRAASGRGNEAAGGVTLSVRVQPRAAKNGIARMEDGSLKVRLTAPPVDGAANEALIAFLAGTFSIGRSSVEILSGQSGRQKIVRITGVSDADLQRVLNSGAK